MSKELVQQQFGDKAADYATSKVHAKGASLQRLVELIDFQPGWLALDVATAAGHTAHAVAPHVGRVVATDLTWTMLPKARELSAERGLINEVFSAADAENLPFPTNTFDLVTCRIAPHHFPDPARFVREAARVLKRGGTFALVDNIVPSTRSRKRREQRECAAAANYVNAFEKLRDPSHGRMLTQPEWEQHAKAANLAITHTETLSKEMDFDPWAERMRVSAADKIRLRAMLVQAPEAVKSFLTPQVEGARITFQLTELILMAKKAI